MTDIVVDASVAVKWLIPEAHHVEARRILTSAYARSAPDLIWPEVGNVLWKQWRRGDLTASATQEMLGQFQRFPVQIEPMRHLTPRAVAIAQETARSVYDCTYLALALERGRHLVTADRRFYNALQGTPYADTMLWVEDVP